MSLLLLLAVLAGAPHPTHTSSAELRLSRGGAEVTLRIFRDDLACAARGAAELAAYVRRTFRLADAAGRAVTLDVVSVREDGDVTVVEARTAVPVAGGTVRHAVLWEHFDDQVNVVRVVRGGRTRTLLFSPGDPAKPLE